MAMSPERLKQLLAMSGIQQPFAPYQPPVGPLPPGAPLRDLQTMPAVSEPPQPGGLAGLMPSQKTLYALGISDQPAAPAQAPQGDFSLALGLTPPSPTIAGPVGGEAPLPPVAEGPAGQLPDIQGPGDLDLAGQRAASEKKLAQLTALRDISEGLGTYIPVKGDIVFGREGRGVEATGIREAMGREEGRMALGEEEAAGRRTLQLQSGLRREETREAMGLKALNDALKGTPMKPLTTETMTRLTAMDHLEKELAMVLKQKGKFNTGPVVNAVETALGWVLGEWAISPEKAGFKSTLNNILAQYVRAVEGGRPSDKDREFLKTVTPTAKDDDQTLILKAKQLQAWTRENRAQLEIYLRNSGYALPEKTGGDQMITVTTGGRTGLVPANQEAGFKAKYGG